MLLAVLGFAIIAGARILSLFVTSSLAATIPNAGPIFSFNFAGSVAQLIIIASNVPLPFGSGAFSMFRVVRMVITAVIRVRGI